MMKKNPPQKAPGKKPPAKKTPPNPPSEPSTVASPPSTDPKQSKVVTAPAKSAMESKPKGSASGEAGQAPQVKKTIVKKIIKKVIKKTPKSAETVKAEVKEYVIEEEKVANVTESKKEEVKAEESSEREEPVVEEVVESAKKKEAVVEEVVESAKEEAVVEEVVESTKKEEAVVEEVVESAKKEEPDVEEVVESAKKEEHIVEEVVESAKTEEAVVAMEVVVEEQDTVEDTNMVENDLPDDVADHMDVGDGKEVHAEEDGPVGNERMVDANGEEVLQEPGEQEGAEDDVSEPDEETEGFEQMEISDIAKEIKIKKAQEIFVGGLDRDAVEDDVKKAFEKMGEILEVRMQKVPSTGKNKGFAFVKFADKEQAARALSEMKNPVIRGKSCGIAPSEDKNTLFLGNISNTWTKEAVKNKLKEYGIESVENINLVADPRHEGFSKGFAFLELSCHADAMLAYKRLQKPDVVFGHPEKTAKVAFAEPLREPDPEVMSQVRSVFVDGLPPQWDEERVREHFKVYGEIESIMLARNRPSAKRKDFGFIDYTTHEAAVACIAGVDNTELGDDKTKGKVKVRLSNPLPKTQAVKGGIRGGFSIGRSGTFSRFGRGIGRGVHYQRGNSYARGQPERFPLGAGRRWPGENVRSQAAASRPRHSAPGRGQGQNIPPRRRQFLSEENFDQPSGRRYFVDDSYLYDGGHGVKRSFSQVEQEAAYVEPSRVRRLHHYDPLVSSRASRRQDPSGADSGYPRDYYGSDYGYSAYPSTYGRDDSYRGGYYY